MNTLTRKIVVCTDFSDSAAVALYHAASLAERMQSQLHMVHISEADTAVTVPTDLGLNVPPQFQEAHDARVRMERLKTMIGSNVDVVVHLRIGQPIHELLAVIRELQPEMVVIGSHGRSPVMQLILGSVSKELMQHSAVPILIVPAPGRQAELAKEEEAASQTAIEPPPADAGMPTVGVAPAQSDTNEEASYTSTTTVSGVGTSPPGTSGYDVNPELRVRY